MRVPPLAARSADRPWDVVVFGENSVDFVARVGAGTPSSGKQPLESFEILTGGQGATAALGCARLGARVCYVGVFGRDGWAARSREALATGGVEVVALERDGARSRVAVILVGRDGERGIFEHRDPRLALEDPTVATGEAGRARVVLVDAVDLPASLAMAKAARKAGARTVLDIDRYGARAMDLLSAIDVIIAPATLIQEAGGKNDLEHALRTLEARLRPLAIVATLGAAGSVAIASGQLIHTPAFSADVLDTTGAGDAFRAGFCAAWAERDEEGELSGLLEFAAATAAINCGSFGAQAGLPTRDEVSRFLTHRAPPRSKI